MSGNHRAHHMNVGSSTANAYIGDISKINNNKFFSTNNISKNKRERLRTTPTIGD